jgi:hypothetical protein
MADMTIRLRIDPETGKKNIIVSLSADEDALPHEHEQRHRALVEKLIQGGIVKASELGKIVVEREEEIPAPTAPVNTTPTEERRAQSQDAS